MSRELTIFIDSLLLSFMLLYVSAKLLNEKIEFNNFKFWIAFLVQTLYLTASYLLTDNFFRVILTYILLAIINILVFQKEVIKSIISSFITMFITFIAEIIYAIILTIIFNIDLEQMQNGHFGIIVTNLAIAFCMYLIINMPTIKKFFVEIVNEINIKSGKSAFLLSVFSISILAVLLYYIYFRTNLSSAFILSLVVISSFSFLTLFFFKEKGENYKLQVEYDSLLNTLEDYEKMYQVQRMANHEYKNQLSIIRGLVSKNKKAISYIDEIIDLKGKTNATWMDKLKRIPEGGLRGLLYYKMLKMDEENINIEFDISQNVTINSIRNIDQKVNLKLCKVLGIYLDNAIQCVSGLKEKNIRISIYLGDKDNSNFVITVMNNFEDTIELDKISEKGYSTKGKGRGFGLAIATDIIDHEPHIKNNVKIIRKNFMQELIYSKTAFKEEKS